MKDMQKILDSIEFIYQELERQKYAAGTIKIYRMIYNGLVKYISSREITALDEKICLDYLYFRIGFIKEGLYGKGNQKINQVLKPLEVLMHYIETGNVEYRMRAKLAPYCCPKQFIEEFNQLQDEFEERHYASATIKSNIQNIKKFLVFLDSEGINTSEEIDASIITKFLKRYEGNKPKYVSTIIYVLRNYLTFLYVQGYTSKNKSVSLPKIRIMRNAFIPYTWKREDVRKLLAVVDRGDAKGKRDYAILLLVVRLGLRVSDIRNMELTNIYWKRKLIILDQTKTKNRIELPLLDDIGWAIIDYLQNGRPKTTCDRVFIRHRAPYGAVGENESFYRELHRYMVAGDIEIPLDSHCGLHSLRSTLARNMLEAETPLPIISETLGHKSIHTTSIYLKIDLEGLRKCALDPEEVFRS
jgi:site-specific recombinase XerD